MYKSRESYSDSSIESYRERPNYSRSRSPIRRSDNGKQKSKLSKKIDAMRSKKNQLIEDKKKLRESIKDLKKEIECLKSSIESYKFGALIFLPCGHQKTVKLKHKNMLDEALEKALSKLSTDEMKNEIFLRQIRSKIFYSIEYLHPEIFRCTQMTKYTNEKCGHVSTAECHETKRYARQCQYPSCLIKVETRFECGHVDFVECSQQLSARCPKCL